MPGPKADAVQKTRETEDDFCPGKRSGVEPCPTPEPPTPKDSDLFVKQTTQDHSTLKTSPTRTGETKRRLRGERAIDEK